MEKSLLPTYLDYFINYFKQSSDTQVISLEKTADELSKIITKGGVFHTFGCGHSALVAAELSYRAGGLACVNFLGLLPGNAGWVAATEAETDSSLATKLISKSGMINTDMVAIVSHSGKSPLVLKVVETAHQVGASVLAVTRSIDTPLSQQADFTLVTDVPPNDCALEMQGYQFGSLSSVVSSTLLNTLVTMTVEKLLAQGVDPMLLKSVHSPNGTFHNQEVMARLKTRIPCWWHNTSVEENK